MLERLKQMLIKEFIQVFRDKRTRIVLFGPPIIQMLIFGYAATFEIRHVATAVLDLDHSQESRELISRFTSSPYFDVQRQLTNSSEVEDIIDRGKATVALQINSGFAEKLRKGQTAPLQVIVDATNSNTALIASGYLNQIVLGFAREYQQDRINRIAPQWFDRLPSVQLEQRPWYNPDLRSRWFFVPGIVGSLTLVIVVNLTAFAVVREREIGTLEQIIVTPIRPAEFIIGKTLPFFLMGLFDVSLIAMVGTLWFQVPLRGQIWVLFSGAILFLLCMLGVGLVISTVSATQQQALVTSFFFIMPAALGLSNQSRRFRRRAPPKSSGEEDVMTFQPESDSSALRVLPDWPARIRELCLQTRSRDPWTVALEAMNWEGFPVAGQAHHGLVAGALMAAYQNSTEKYDKKAITSAMHRAETLPAGFCAGFGADAGAIAAGIVISVIYGNTARSEHSATRRLAHQMTAHCMLAIANNTGNRCCKRTVFQVLETATNFIEATVWVALNRTPLARLSCAFAAKNDLCNQEACRYFPI